MFTDNDYSPGHVLYPVSCLHFSLRTNAKETMFQESSY